MADQNEATEGTQHDEHEHERAEQELKEFSEQDELPSDPREWPDGKARFKSFGDEGEAYGEGPTEKLGPADVVHHDDGSITVGGEKVDNPDEFKGEPIPGGPTDPQSPSIGGEHDKSEA